MTDEQKDILIAKMLATPASLSDEELGMIMHDNELRDIYEMSAAVSGACTSRKEINMADEWARFRPRIRRKPSPMLWIMKVAAIFLAIIVISGIISMALDKILIDNQPKLAEISQQEVIEYNISEQNITDSLSQEIDTIQDLILPQKNVIKPKKHLAKANVTEVEMTYEPKEIDIDEYLRIQQARIDNDLAMITAENMTDEIAAIHRIYDIIGEDDETIVNTIRTLTMQ